MCVSPGYTWKRLPVTDRGSAINEGSCPCLTGNVKQMFSLQTSFQAVRNEKGEEDFLSSPRANAALAKLLRSRSQAAHPAWTAVLELLLDCRAAPSQRICVCVRLAPAAEMEWAERML